VGRNEAQAGVDQSQCTPCWMRSDFGTFVAPPSALARALASARSPRSCSTTLLLEW